MTIPEPASDLSRAERKAFRTMAQRLADRGVDVISRVGLIDEYVRSETRLATLREAEKAAENGAKMAATRAVNVAAAERRRLHDGIFKGVDRQRPKTMSERVVIAVEATSESSNLNEAHEAWRDYFHWRPRGKPQPPFSDHERLEAKYGPPGFAPLLNWCVEEERAWSAMMDACNNRPSGADIQSVRDQIPGGKFEHETRAPQNVSITAERYDG